MSKTIEDIRGLLRGISEAGKYEIMDGVVDVVHEDDRLVDVRIDEGIVLHDVKLRAVSNGESDGIVCIPKLGSRVVFAMVRGTSDYVLIRSSELDKLIIETEVKLELNAPETVFNDGENDGLVLLHKLEDNLNAIRNYLNVFKNAVSSGFNAVGVGTSANGGTGNAAFQSGMASNQLNYEDMGNDKIKQ